MHGHGDELKAGMSVRDAQAEQVGHIIDVGDDTLVIQVQHQVTIPHDAIAAVGENTVVVDTRSADWVPAAVEELGTRAHTGRVCAACGVTEGEDRRYVRHGDAWFCLDCWRRLPSMEVEQAEQTITLQGVPLS